MWHYLLIALALVFVVEGILPFLSPASWRQMMRMATEMSDTSLRRMGFVSMLIGVVLLYLLK
jgi:uncharacterized protein YjeT (DUF2065 family)